jgi:hypothetical protein
MARELPPVELMPDVGCMKETYAIAAAFAVFPLTCSESFLSLGRDRHHSNDCHFNRKPHNGGGLVARPGVFA